MTKVHTNTSFSHFQHDYTNLGMSVLRGSFSKYADRNKTKYAAKICGIMPRSHIRIKSTYGNEESDSLCGKICDMHTFGKCANNDVTHKTDIPIFSWVGSPSRTCHIGSFIANDQSTLLRRPTRSLAGRAASTDSPSRDCLLFH